MLTVIISTVSGIVFLILRDTTNVTDNRFTETYNAMGPTGRATTFLRSSKKASWPAPSNLTAIFIERDQTLLHHISSSFGNFK